MCPLTSSMFIKKNAACDGAGAGSARVFQRCRWFITVLMKFERVMHLKCLHNSCPQYVCLRSVLYCIASFVSNICFVNIFGHCVDTQSAIANHSFWQVPRAGSALGPSGVWFLESHVRPPVNCNKQAGHLISGLIFVLQRRPFRRGLDKGEDKVEPHWKVTVAAKQCNPSTHSFQRMPNSSLKMSCGPRLH